MLRQLPVNHVVPTPATTLPILNSRPVLSGDPSVRPSGSIIPNSQLLDKVYSLIEQFLPSSYSNLDAFSVDDPARREALLAFTQNPQYLELLLFQSPHMMADLACWLCVTFEQESDSTHELVLRRAISNLDPFILSPTILQGRVAPGIEPFQLQFELAIEWVMLRFKMERDGKAALNTIIQKTGDPNTDIYNYLNRREEWQIIDLILREAGGLDRNHELMEKYVERKFAAVIFDDKVSTESCLPENFQKITKMVNRVGSKIKQLRPKEKSQDDFTLEQYLSKDSSISLSRDLSLVYYSKMFATIVKDGMLRKGNGVFKYSNRGLELIISCVKHGVDLTLLKAKTIQEGTSLIMQGVVSNNIPYDENLAENLLSLIESLEPEIRDTRIQEIFTKKNDFYERFTNFINESTRAPTNSFAYMATGLATAAVVGTGLIVHHYFMGKKQPKRKPHLPHAKAPTQEATTAPKEEKNPVATEKSNSENFNTLIEAVEDLQDLFSVQISEIQEILDLLRNIPKPNIYNRDLQKSLLQTIAEATESYTKASELQKEFISQRTALEVIIATVSGHITDLHRKIKSIKDNLNNMPEVNSEEHRAQLQRAETVLITLNEAMQSINDSQHEISLDFFNILSDIQKVLSQAKKEQKESDIAAKKVEAERKKYQGALNKLTPAVLIEIFNKIDTRNILAHDLGIFINEQTQRVLDNMCNADEGEKRNFNHNKSLTIWLVDYYIKLRTPTLQQNHPTEGLATDEQREPATIEQRHAVITTTKTQIKSAPRNEQPPEASTSKSGSSSTQSQPKQTAPKSDNATLLKKLLAELVVIGKELNKYAEKVEEFKQKGLSSDTDRIVYQAYCRVFAYYITRASEKLNSLSLSTNNGWIFVARIINLRNLKVIRNALAHSPSLIDEDNEQLIRWGEQLSALRNINIAAAFTAANNLAVFDFQFKRINIDYKDSSHRQYITHSKKRDKIHDDGIIELPDKKDLEVSLESMLDLIVSFSKYVNSEDTSFADKDMFFMALTVQISMASEYFDALLKEESYSDLNSFAATIDDVRRFRNATYHDDLILHEALTQQVENCKEILAEAIIIAKQDMPEKLPPAARARGTSIALKN